MTPERQPRPRRQFIKEVSVATAGVLLHPSLPAADTNAPAPSEPSLPGSVPRRTLGRTGEELSIIGVGGHTLALADEGESIQIVHAAIEAGVNFMDNAWDYHGGRSETVMGKALKGRRDGVFLMTKVCAHIRGQTKQAAMEMLEESLTRLQTDRLDLWMLHELTTMDQANAAFAAGGPLEGLLEAKKQGKVRYIGFTGHQSAEVHMAMLKHDFPFDAVLMPVNAFESDRKGFRTEVLPELRKRGIGILGMKSLGGTPARILKDGKYTARQLLRFSLSHEITAQVVGMSSLRNLTDNLETVRHFSPMPRQEMESLVAELSRDKALQAYAEYHRPGYRDGRGLVA
jgi:uncharacterized protein